MIAILYEVISRYGLNERHRGAGIGFSFTVVAEVTYHVTRYPGATTPVYRWYILAMLGLYFTLSYNFISVMIS